MEQSPSLGPSDKARASLLEPFNGRYQLKNNLCAQREDPADGVKV